MTNIIRLSPEMIARCEAWAREIVAHYGGDDLHAMPWSRHMMASDDLRQWLASREQAGRMIDIETCEIGCWYANANGDPYGIRDMLGEEAHLEKGYTDKFNWVRSPESRGWVNEGDLPPAKAKASMTGFIAKPSGDERTTAAPGLCRSLATGAANRRHPVAKGISQDGTTALPAAVCFAFDQTGAGRK